MSQLQDRLTSVAAFRPSFAGQSIDILRDLTESAFGQAVDPIFADNIVNQITASPNEREYKLAFALVGNAGWFSFGHISSRSQDLSGHFVAQVTFKFSSNDLDQVEIKLFLLNSQFIVSESGFTPAIIGANYHYAVTGGTEEVGLRPLLTKTKAGSQDKDALFAELAADLRVDLLPPPAADWNPIDKDGLRSRIELFTTWKRKNGAFQTDATGVIAKAAAKVLGDERTALVFWAPTVAAVFTGVLHESERFGLCLTDGDGFATLACIALGEHDMVGNAAQLKTAKRDFALGDDFRGVVFGGLGAHWLDDGMMGADIISSASRGAVSFQEQAVIGASPARFHASVTAKVNPTNKGSYLSILQSGAELKLSVSGAKLRQCSLAATFKVIADKDNPFAWLSARKATIELKSIGLADAGPAKEDYKLDITLDGTSGGRLVTVTAGSLGVDQETFNYLASVLALAPVLKLAGARVASGTTAKDQRVQFVEIGSGAFAGALFAASALGNSWFFKKALLASEFRVTGVRILSQPTTGGRETALLFDVETEFSVETKDPELKSSKALAVRVENTGILEKGGTFYWVQAIQGALELKTLDGSSWDFGGLGGLLALKKISFQLTDVPLLSLTVGLSINLGVVTADDFKVTLNLITPAKDITFYPTTLKVNVPGVLEGTGTVDLGPPGHALDEVAGSLDLTLASKLRLAGAVQIRKFQDDTADFTAFAAGALVEWPNAIPFGTSGLGIKGIQAVYTSHFKRVEKAGVNGIPPALQWLKDAEGDVAIGAISNKALWAPEYDRWSFGAGALFVIVGADGLLSINTMLLVELPGPRILGFVKVNPFEEAKSNKDKKDELTFGILGVLEIDFLTNRLRVGALIDLDLADFATLQGSTDMEWTMGSLTQWHYFIGHFNRPIEVKLKLGDIFNAGATGYFMAAGDKIESVPSGSGGIRDLPGLALALGARAYARLGKGELYLSMEMQAFLNVSLGRNIYASGELELSGELYIFIGGIGASGRMGFEYYKDASGTYLSIYGELCGRIRIGFLKMKGCVGARIGGAVPRAIAIPALVGSVTIVSGTNVALHGQGAVAKIDQVLARLATAGAAEDAKGIPIDSVIAISLAGPPVKDGHAGFLDRLEDACDVSEFNYGAKKGGYLLSDVSLFSIADDGTATAIDHAHADAVWWRSPQRSGDGHAIPLELALLTRTPFGAPNAVPSSGTIQRWIDALADGTGVCSTLDPQLSINTFPKHRVSGEENGGELTWMLGGRWRSVEAELAIGNPSLTTLTASIENRAGYGSKNDSAGGLPRFLGRVVVEQPRPDATPIGFLEMRNLPNEWDKPRTRLILASQGFAPTGPAGTQLVELLVGADDPMTLKDDIYCFDDAGTPIAVDRRWEPIADGGDAVHEGSGVWKVPVTGFLELPSVAGYGALRFARLIVELKDPAAWQPAHPPVKLVIQFAPDPKHGPLPKVFVGAIKYLAIEEYRRHAAQMSFNAGVIKEIEAYLRPRAAPLLEPSARYRLRLSWATHGSEITPDGDTEDYNFTTDVDPPRALAPYLLGTYPTPEARFHPPGQQIGLALSSGDILKILTKFPGAALRVTVREDGNNPVTGTSGRQVLDWNAGRIYDPAELLDLLHEPVGLVRKTFLGLPSALLRAIKAAIAAGKLGCLDKTIELDKGMWLGIEAELEPLRGYTVALELVDKKSNSPWPYQGQANRTEAPFFQWHFRTGLHRDIPAHAKAFARPSKRHRLLVEGAIDTSLASALRAIARDVAVSEEYCDTDLKGHGPSRIPETLAVIEDHQLEDLLAKAIGARTVVDGETETLLIWNRTGGKYTVAAIVVRSLEPICRRTDSVRIRHVGNGDNQADIMEREEMTVRYPSASGSEGIDLIFASTSGETVVVIPDHAEVEKSGRLILKVQDIVPQYLPHSDSDELADLIQIRATEMTR